MSGMERLHVDFSMLEDVLFAINENLEKIANELKRMNDNEYK